MASLGVQQTRATGHYALTYHQGGLLTPLCCLSWISVNLELWFEELIITGISRSFVSKVILETRNSKKLRHSPLCCTEDISLITFQFEWLLEVGAVLWHRGHDTYKENAWQWTVTQTKKTRDRETWRCWEMKSKHCAQSIWTAGEVVRQDQKLASRIAATNMCTHTHSHADTHAHRGSTSSSNKPRLLDPLDCPARVEL